MENKLYLESFKFCQSWLTVCCSMCNFTSSALFEEKDWHRVTSHFLKQYWLRLSSLGGSVISNWSNIVIIMCNTFWCFYLNLKSFSIISSLFEYFTFYRGFTLHKRFFMAHSFCPTYHRWNCFMDLIRLEKCLATKW